MTNDLIVKAKTCLAKAQNVTCLSGAGISAESGISTFRDPQTGYWSKFDPVQLASQSGFERDPGLVWRWYMERLWGSTIEAQPNPGHSALARLEQQVPNFTLITQNVDNLHEQAGSKNVIHIHGNISVFFCNSCRRDHLLTEGDQATAVPPTCAACGGMVRPGVVWFGEQLPVNAIDTAWQASQDCDVMLVVGTSGLVYPAAHLPKLAKDAGATLIDINPERDALSGLADIFLQGPSGEILPKIVSES